ncbi:MAG: hypothetical protein DMF67_16445 [Acidobacteria bacterium]|nr:MAG: hypothetical protein DMF67_16445 [Acidobacteriota bacterium]
MRRHTLLLAAGSSAYFVGASVNSYLRRTAFRGSGGAGGRVVAVADRPRAVLLRPLKAIRFLVARACND